MAPPYNPNPFDPASYQSLIAPYQAMAQNLYPQDPLQRGSQPSAFAVAHPQLNQFLGNALLTASQIQPQPTIGGNIANVAGAVLGTSQWHREQALKQQLLPYQMVQPQIALQKSLADINELNSRSQLYGAQGQYYNGAKTALTNAQTDRQNTLAQGKMVNEVDDEGHPWSLDLNTGASIPVGWQPQEGYQPSFQMAHMRSASVGGLEGEALRQAMPPGLNANQQALFTIDFNNKWHANQAGAATSGAQGASHQFASEQDIVEQQKADLFKDLPPLPKDADTYAMGQLMAGKDISTSTDEYNQLVADRKKEVQSRTDDFASYKASKAPSQGVGFFTWRQNPGAYSSGKTKASTDAPVKPPGW